jgi:hypothetical protein
LHGYIQNIGARNPGELEPPRGCYFEFHFSHGIQTSHLAEQRPRKPAAERFREARSPVRFIALFGRAARPSKLPRLPSAFPASG